MKSWLKFILALLMFAAAPLLAQVTISNVYVASSTASTATVVWTTNTASNSQVVFGINGGSLQYSTPINPSLVTSHSVQLILLSPVNTYSFAAVSGGVQSSTYSFQLCNGSTGTPLAGTANNYYEYGSYTLTWVPPAGSSGTATLCGSPIATTLTGPLSGSGSFSATVANSYAVTPGPGSWQVVLRDVGNLAPITVTTPVGAQSTDISTQLQVVAAASGLTNVLANTISGQFYPPIGGGGGGTTTYPVTFNNSGTGAASGTTFNGSAPQTISWNTLGAQQALTLTTTGSSGAATLLNGALNIPNYAGGGGTITGVTAGTGLSGGGTTGTVTVSIASQAANTVLGALTATTPSALPVPPCSATGSALTWTSGSGFGCATGFGTGNLSGSLTNTYLPVATSANTVANSQETDDGTNFTTPLNLVAPSASFGGSVNGTIEFGYTGTASSALPSNGITLAQDVSVSAPYKMTLGAATPFSGLSKWSLSSNEMYQQKAVGGTDYMYADGCYMPATTGPQAIDTLLATAKAAVTSTQGTCVKLGPYAYTISGMFAEPEQTYGVSIFGVPSMTQINLIANNSGSPWEAAIFAGNSVQKGFSLAGFTLDCTNGTVGRTTVINANHGLELQWWRLGNFNSNVVVQNCGTGVRQQVTSYQVTAANTVVFTGTNTYNYGDKIMPRDFATSVFLNGYEFIVTSASSSAVTAVATGTAFSQTTTGVVTETGNTFRQNFEPNDMTFGEFQTPAPTVVANTTGTTTYAYACDYIGIPGYPYYGGGTTGVSGVQAETMGYATSISNGAATANNTVTCPVLGTVVNGSSATSIKVYRTFTNAAITAPTTGVIGTITGNSGSLTDTGASGDGSSQPNRQAGGRFYNFQTLYNDGDYYGVGSGGGTNNVPPPTGIHGTTQFYDSNMYDTNVKNALECPIRLDGGGVKMDGSHSFGFAGTPQNFFPTHNFCEFGGDKWIGSYADTSNVSGFYIQNSGQKVEVDSTHWYQSSGYTYPQKTNGVVFGNLYPSNYRQTGGDTQGMTSLPGSGPGNVNAQSTLGFFTYTSGLTGSAFCVDAVVGGNEAICNSNTNTGASMWKVQNPNGCAFAGFNDNGTFSSQQCNGATRDGQINYSTPSNNVRIQFLNSAFQSALTIGQTGVLGVGGMCASTTNTCTIDTATWDATHFIVQQQGTATSGTNYGSALLQWCGSYYSGAATPSCWTAQNNVGTGTTPTINLVFANGGPNGGAVVVPQFSDTGTANFGSAGATSFDATGNINSSTNSISMLGGTFTTATANTYLSAGTSPTAVVNTTYAGTGGTCSVTGKNGRFNLFLTTGTGTTGSGTLCTVTWGGGYTYTNTPIATFSANNQASIVSATDDVYPTASTTGMTFNVGTTALSTGTTFSWSFTVGSY